MVSRQPTSGPLLWLASRVLASADPVAELRRSLDLLDEDTTARELRYALPDDASIAVLGWPDAASQAVPVRGDLEVFVVDVLGEGSAFVQRLWNDDIDAVDVPLAGLGAAIGEVDLVLLETPAVGPTECLAVSASRAAAAVARHCGVPVWAVAGVGRLLPDPLWLSLRNRVLSEEPWDADEELVPLDLVTGVVGPTGVVPVAEALQAVDCAVAPELLRGGI